MRLVVDEHVSYDFTKSVERLLPKLGGIREGLYGRSDLHVVRRLTETFPGLKGVHPRGWPSRLTWASVEGIYSRSLFGPTVGSTRHITAVAEQYREKGFWRTTKPGRLEYVFFHEVGHAFSERWLNTKLWFEDDFREAYLAARPIAAEKKSLKYFVQKNWHAGAQECYAHAFAEIFTRHGSDKAFRRVFRDCLDIVREEVREYK